MSAQQFFGSKAGVYMRFQAGQSDAGGAYRGYNDPAFPPGYGGAFTAVTYREGGVTRIDTTGGTPTFTVTLEIYTPTFTPPVNYFSTLELVYSGQSFIFLAAAAASSTHSGNRRRWEFTDVFGAPILAGINFEIWLY